MSDDITFRLTQYRSPRSILVMAVIFCCVIPAAGQYPAASAGAGQASSLTGSVPSGPASNEVLPLTLRDAITRGLRYNLATIESGENARIARGQRLVALSRLLPQVSAGLSENVDQLSLATFGLQQIHGIPNIVGPFSYTSVDGTVSQTLFSFESIQRFRAARTAEQAAQLSYQDIFDAVTLTVGNSYLQVIEADSRIQAQEAQVRNARALYDQAIDEVQAGTAPANRSDTNGSSIAYGRVQPQYRAQQFSTRKARSWTRHRTAPWTRIRTCRPISLLGNQSAHRRRCAERSPTNRAAISASALDSEKSAAQTLSAARGERYPVVAVNGDYGDIGPNTRPIAWRFRVSGWNQRSDFHRRTD